MSGFLNAAQYGAGVAGPIVFEGPASANYDVDLGVYPVNEWYYGTVWQQSAIAMELIQSFAPPPFPDNLLINGTNKVSVGAGA